MATNLTAGCQRYPDCTHVSPVVNYAKTEKETTNNTLVFDLKAP